MEQFKIRASGSGSIMSNPIGKNNEDKYQDALEKIIALEKQYDGLKNKECKTAIDLVTIKIPETNQLIEYLKPIRNVKELSETTKNFVYDWIKERIYGYRKPLKAKQLTKGIELEDEAIDKAIEWLDLPFAIKNTERFEDEHFTGEPDLIVGDTVYDIKCSWDAYTFPLFENEIPTKGYETQLQVYMHLTGKKRARLVYVLLNTPEHLIYEPQNTHDHLDKKYRIKTFDVEFDPSVIEDLKSRVLQIREFIKTLKY